MKRVDWTDERGWKHARLVQRDDVLQDPNEGIPLEPPDIERLDWEAIKRTLHNELFNRGLIDWRSVQRSGNGLQAAIQAALHRPLQSLYREHLQQSREEQ